LFSLFLQNKNFKQKQTGLKIDSKIKFRMKKAPRRPHKPWFKKRKPAGRLLKRSANDSTAGDNKNQENLETFVGYHKKSEDNEEDSRTIEFYVDEGCPYLAWKLYFPTKSKKNY
jgi:hypothetical protein